MTKVIKRSKTAAAIAGMLALAGSASVAAQVDLQRLQSEQNEIHRSSAQSQQRIDSLFDQSRELLADYRDVVSQYESLRLYNDHVQRLVDDQNAQLESLQRQIDGIEATRQGVVPLMYRMIDSLEEFVRLDVPIRAEQRTERVERLRELMTRSNVTDSEKFRQIMETYQAEMDRGVGLVAYQGDLELDGQTVAVDFFHLGRVAFLAQSLDLRNGWMWDNNAREWVELDDEFLNPLTNAIRMARRQTQVDVVRLPIPAPETAQ